MILSHILAVMKYGLAVTFGCDIPVVFYRVNTMYITSSQNTTKILLHCVVPYVTQLHVSALF